MLWAPTWDNIFSWVTPTGQGHQGHLCAGLTAVCPGFWACHREAPTRLPCSTASEARRHRVSLVNSTITCAQFCAVVHNLRTKIISKLNPYTEDRKYAFLCMRTWLCHVAVFSITLLFRDPSAQTNTLIVPYICFSKYSSTAQWKVLIDIKASKVTFLQDYFHFVVPEDKRQATLKLQFEFEP